MGRFGGRRRRKRAGALGGRAGAARRGKCTNLMKEGSISMRIIAQVSVLMLASTLAPVVLAQSPSGPDGESPFPYAPPTGFGSSAPQPAPENPEWAAQPSADAEGYAPADDQGEEYLQPDEAIADSYDDGYDPQASAEFQQTLAPYGSWVNDADYGQVWLPAVAIVGADFLPYYSNGHWVLSEYGWTWVSDWSWGWGPFHYGRWLRMSSRGWCWVPGTTWGPAWVSWRSGGGYVGWAPLPPRGVTLAAAIPATGRWSPWRFTPAGSLAGARATGLAPARVPGVFGRTTVVANDRLLTHGNYAVHVNAGPARVAQVSPVRLATVAPRALPRATILPRPGTAISARPWAGVASAGTTTRPSPAASGWQDRRQPNRRGGGWSSQAPTASVATTRVDGARPVMPAFEGSRANGWGGAHAMAPLPSRPAAPSSRPNASAPTSLLRRPTGSANYVAPSWRGASPSVSPPVAATPAEPARQTWSGSANRAYTPPAQVAASRPVYAAPAPRFEPRPAPGPTPGPAASHWAPTPAPVHAAPAAAMARPVGSGLAPRPGGAFSGRR